MIKHRQKININANIEKTWFYLSNLQSSLVFDKYYSLIELPSNYSINRDLKFNIYTKYFIKTQKMDARIINSQSPTKLEIQCNSKNKLTFNHKKNFELIKTDNHTILIYYIEGTFNNSIINLFYSFFIKIASNVELRYLKKAIESSEYQLGNKHLQAIVK